MRFDIQALCSRKIPCSCGRTHFCGIAAAVAESGAISRLPAYTAAYRHILLIADTNTYAACGEQAAALLGERLQKTLIYRREGMLVPDETAIAEAEAALSPDTDFVVGVGSGVIQDLCKYVTWRHGLEYCIVATAPSMDGYASTGAAMIIGGMKVTYTAHAPRYILADIDVLCRAPMDMIRSGYGDIIGKYSSLNDWRLSRLVQGEYLCQEVYDLVKQATDELRACAGQLQRRDPAAIRLLAEALILVGITLSLVNTTRPGSGSEHHMSHFFEIVGLIRHEPYFLHGTDVAYSTIETARVREVLRALPAPAFHTETAAGRQAAWQRIYGPYAGEVDALQRHFGLYDRDMNALYREKWPQIVRILQDCPTAAEIGGMLTDAGFDLSAFERLYGRAKIEDALLYGKDLKERFSVLWLWYALFSEGGAP